MEKSNLLNNLEKEYLVEIKNGKISLENLLENGIKKQDLDAELILRNALGDAFITNAESTEENLSGEKQIQKINEQDISLNKELTKEFENIETDEFNNALEQELIKVNNK